MAIGLDLEQIVKASFAYSVDITDKLEFGSWARASGDMMKMYIFIGIILCDSKVKGGLGRRRIGCVEIHGVVVSLVFKEAIILILYVHKKIEKKCPQKCQRTNCLPRILVLNLLKEFRVLKSSFQNIP